MSAIRPIHSIPLLLLLIHSLSALHLYVDTRYNSTVRSVINAACPAMPSVFVTDLDAPNWIYGSMNPGQYTNAIDALSQTRKVVKCPPALPFSDGTACVRCLNNELFNLQTKRCVTPPTGMFFSQRERAFTIHPPILFNTNQNNLPSNFVGMPPPTDPLAKICPPEAPFSNMTDCISCNLPNYFDFGTSRCQSCPPGQSFSLQDKRCVTTIINNIVTNIVDTPLRFFTDLTRPNILVPSRNMDEIAQEQMARLNSVPNIEKTACPIEAPFFDGKRCIGCPPDKPLFNIERLRCEVCQRGYKYSPDTHKCQIQMILYLTSPDAPNLMFSKEDPLSYRQRFEVDKQQHPVCPQVTPYFNGDKCISCNPQNPVFDIDKLMCVSCPPTKVFDPKINRCVRRVEVTPSLERYLMNIR